MNAALDRDGSYERVCMSLITDLRFALRSLARVKGLTITVVLTLALGIGANAAIFSVVRGVLLRPLANRDEERLIYVRQSAPGIGADNAAFSVPEIQDLRARVKTVASFGDFSTIDFTMVRFSFSVSAGNCQRSTRTARLMFGSSAICATPGGGYQERGACSSS